MSEIVEFEKKETIKEKFEKFKMGVRSRAGQAWDWCKEHKEVAIPIATAAIGAVAEVGKAIIKANDHRKEREMEEQRLESVYDRSAGMYLETKRPLTNSDYIRIQSLKRQGMTTGEALIELDLLKKD